MEEEFKKILRLKLNSLNIDVFRNINVAVDEFFKDKVIIQKGENRHPDADVLYSIAEDMDSYYCSGMWEKGSSMHTLRYSIKPSEPIYEYQYLRIDGDKAYETEDFLTEEEAKVLGFKIRLEKTKRPRGELK